MLRISTKKALKTVVTFPGQGKLVSPQFIKDLGVKYDITQYNGNILQPPLDDIILNLEKYHPEQLERTSVLQPTVVASSLLILDILTKRLGGHGLDAHYTLGHSLGELTALVANGVWRSDLASTIAYQRGSKMEECINFIENKDKYGMTALIFLKPEFYGKIQEIVKTTSTVGVANNNTPLQVVITGEKAEIDKVVNQLKNHGKFKEITLKGGIPFHNPLLKDAQVAFKKFLNSEIQPYDEQKFDLPVPIVSNVNASIVRNNVDAIENMISCVSKTVRFSESVQNVLKESNQFRFVNIGPNSDVISGMLKKLDPEKKIVEVFNIESPADIDHFVSNTE